MSWTVDHIFRPILTAPPLIQFKPPTNHCSDRDFSFSRALSSRIQLFFGTGKKVFRNSRSRRFLGTDFVTSVSVLSAAPQPPKRPKNAENKIAWIGSNIVTEIFLFGTQTGDHLGEKESNRWFWNEMRKKFTTTKILFLVSLGQLKGHLSESSTVRKQC